MPTLQRDDKRGHQRDEVWPHAGEDGTAEGLHASAVCAAGESRVGNHRGTGAAHHTVDSNHSKLQAPISHIRLDVVLWCVLHISAVSACRRLYCLLRSAGSSLLGEATGAARRAHGADRQSVCASALRACRHTGRGQARQELCIFTTADLKHTPKVLQPDMHISLTSLVHWVQARSCSSRAPCSTS